MAALFNSPTTSRLNLANVAAWDDLQQFSLVIAMSARAFTTSGCIVTKKNATIGWDLISGSSGNVTFRKTGGTTLTYSFALINPIVHTWSWLAMTVDLTAGANDKVHCYRYNIDGFYRGEVSPTAVNEGATLDSDAGIDVAIGGRSDGAAVGSSIWVAFTGLWPEVLSRPDQDRIVRDPWVRKNRSMIFVLPGETWPAMRNYSPRTPGEAVSVSAKMGPGPALPMLVKGWGSSGAGTTLSRITGTSAGVGAGTGALDASGELSASSAGAATATGALDASGELSGSSAGAGAGTGALDASGELSGSSAGAATAAGAVDASGELSGTSAGVGSGTGAVDASGELSGAAAGAGTAAADLDGGTRVTGTSDGAGSGTGAIDASGELSGSSAGVGAADGNLEGTAPGQLSGESDGTGTASGNLDAAGEMAGTSSGAGAGTADVDASGDLSGTAAGTGTAAADLRDANVALEAITFTDRGIPGYRFTDRGLIGIRIVQTGVPMTTTIPRPEPTRVNCRSKFRFQVDTEIPNDAGELDRPEAAIEGLEFALSASENGAAIHPDVDGLVLVPTIDRVDRLYCEVGPTELGMVLEEVQHGGTFWLVLSKSGSTGKESIRYIALDGRVINP